MLTINNRFLTSFGMTGSFLEFRGRSGDSLEIIFALLNSGANRRFFP
jgi:hypothetical protein